MIKPLKMFQEEWRKLKENEKRKRCLFKDELNKYLKQPKRKKVKLLKV